MNKQLLKLIYKLKDTVSGGNRVILYINGSEILPKPLDPQMEAECLATLGKNPKSEQLLIEHNLRLVVFIAKKFETATAGLEDLISIGTIGLIKAIHTFRTDKNIKLATYASRCIENEILMYLRKMGNSRQDLSIDEPLNVDWEGNELLLCDILSGEEDTVYQSIEQDEDRRLIRTAIQKLEPREQTIINLRYGITNGKEKTQKEVADMLGISQSYISRLEKKIIKSLKDKLSSNF